MNTGTIEAPTIGIGRLLREGSQYVVPDHQRDFAWSEDEIDQLICDMEEARSNGRSEYFLGLMVFMPGANDTFQILDGQQRLATATLLLAAVRRWLRDRGYDDDAAKIQSDYIAERELGSAAHTQRIVLNETNNPVYEKAVVGEQATDEIEAALAPLSRYHANRKLYEGVLFCRRRIAELAQSSATGSEEGVERLYQFVRFLDNGVRVVRLVVANEANAYTVFETLNDRGLDLTVLDLVKNYLFGKAGSGQRLREVQAKWLQMMANLSNVRADDFLKSWWTSRYGRVQTAQLFPQFKESVVTWGHANSVSSDLLDSSEKYAALETSDDPVWAQVDDRARESIAALKLLGAKQVHPVLLSALEKLTPLETGRVLRLLEVLIVRYQFIGGGRTGRLEIACASLARRIYSGEIKTAAEARLALKDIHPSDEEFRTAFLTKQETNSRKITYLLRNLEIQARRDADQRVGGIETGPIAGLTVEHVLPRRPGAEWKKAFESDPDLLEDALHRLGNLCLLTDVNRRLGNVGFDEKRAVYDRSELLLTREVSAFDSWGRQAIDQRQDRMAKRALTVWRSD